MDSVNGASSECLVKKIKELLADFSQRGSTSDTVVPLLRQQWDPLCSLPCLVCFVSSCRPSCAVRAAELDVCA